jgi:hypothetical protein
VPNVWICSGRGNNTINIYIFVVVLFKTAFYEVVTFKFTMQEIWPKLQEGKAIVRFASASGASNFLYNHNTPGICVRYL